MQPNLEDFGGRIRYRLSQGLSYGQGMAREELLRGKAAAAFKLQFENAQRAVSAPDDDAAFFGTQNLARRTGQVG